MSRKKVPGRVPSPGYPDRGGHRTGGMFRDPEHGVLPGLFPDVSGIRKKQEGSSHVCPNR